MKVTGKGDCEAKEQYDVVARAREPLRSHKSTLPELRGLAGMPKLDIPSKRLLDDMDVALDSTDWT